MKIAELFVNLGVKGKDSSKSALKGVKDGLGDVKSMGIETKAIIAAVVYGLEKMMSQSAQMGSTLTNFTALTDISNQSLQQWQYAMRQTGGSAEELTGNLKSVQTTMTNMLLNGNAPEGLAMVANKVGLDKDRMRDTLYVMGQLQKFAQLVPADVGMKMVKSFGVSEGTFAAMRRNAFRPEVFSKAPIYGAGEISQLDKVNVAWGNLGQKIEMAFGHLTAKHGLGIVKEISSMTAQVFKLVEALTVLGEKLKVFQILGKTFEVLAGFTTMAAQGVQDLSGNSQKNVAEKGSKLHDVFEWRNKIDKSVIDFAKSITPSNVSPSQNNQVPQSVEVNQTLNFKHDGKDHRKTADSVHKAVKDAYRQQSAQSQGT